MRSMIIGFLVSAIFTASARADDKSPSAKYGQRITLYHLKNVSVKELLPKFQREIDRIIAKRKNAGIVARDAKTYAIPDSASNTLLVVTPQDMSWSVGFYVRELDRPKISKDESRFLEEFLHSPSAYSFTRSLKLNESINKQLAQPPKRFFTEKENRIVASLMTPIKLKFRTQTLIGVIRDIASHADVNVVFDGPALKELGLKSDSPVKVMARGESLKTLLNRFLPPLGLGYDIRDEVLYITSSRSLSGKGRLQIYPVADLIASVRKGKPVIDFTPVIREIERVASNRKTKTKDATRGIGVVPSKLAIAVWQTASGHRAIAKRLNELRRERMQQLAR